MGQTAEEVNSQLLFLEQIKARLPASLSLADELAESLNLSRDSAYRRIRGETILSLDETRKLYQRHGVSVDALFSPDSRMVPFFQTALEPSNNLMQWLTSIRERLTDALATRDCELTFAAKDVPIFHFFRNPDLTAFKLFFWQKTLVREPQHVRQTFAPDVLPNEIMQEAARVWAAYGQFPCTEIWSTETITATLKQIEFYHECGFFSDPKMASHLCDQLIGLMHEIKTEIGNGKKSEGGDFRLYENGILIADNTILARLANQQMVFISYNTTDLLTTTDQGFCDQTQAYFDNLIENSTLISASAMKERNKFFNKILEQIESLKRKLA